MIKGFLTSALSSGIKKKGKLDLGLLYSEVPSVSAGVFTTNKVKSGSVIVSEENIKKCSPRAVIVNSGNANACVKDNKDLKDAKYIVSLCAKELGIKKEEVLIASTGVIGKKLPADKIKSCIPSLVKKLNSKSAKKFALSIMTTDTVSKEACIKVKIGGSFVKIYGVCKGSGMISPDMATMLAFFSTDAKIEKKVLKKALKEAVDASFNKITVDGETSTNDCVLIFANELSNNNPIKENTVSYNKFVSALKLISVELAKKIVLDGEGANKFIEVLVKGAKTKKDAEKIARCVTNSPLIKTMAAGGDPNWGRVLVSVGRSGANIHKDKIDIYFDKKKAVKNGKEFAERKTLISIFKKKNINITIDVKMGKHSDKMWTCDLTKKYVEINSTYEV